MAKSIMIQGTMSNAGKSLLVAGLCRIFKQDGYRVAPFKSQNMALNSFITKEGLEMGRAQVMQAEAAGIEPTVQMNPILLKPTNDTGSQVIVNGQVRANMAAREYFRYKKELIPDILEAYHALEEQYDIIVIEGAGSPAEINLKTDDIVNMGMARMADAPVLLVGDIDRGGVFAQLYGTVELLEPEEKERIRGLVINKFRGDKTILDPGVHMIEEKTSIPVVGVVPYMDVDVEDEDSLSQRLVPVASDGVVAAITIAVIRLPRISNFTDFNIFDSIEGVAVSYVQKVSELGHPDMIILPGTKNTMGDLLWLRQSGLEGAILKERHRGTVLFGVCGGYQMLGMQLSDPKGVENGGVMRGMGLLPMETVFVEEKTRTRVHGTICGASGVLSRLNGIAFEGYEIHMGVSKCQTKDIQAGAQQQPLAFTSVWDEVSGVHKEEGVCMDEVYGTYVHGIFDQEAIAQGIVQSLAAYKGINLPQMQCMDYKEYKQTQYDKMAEILRQYLDLEKIYQILEEGI